MLEFYIKVVCYLQLSWIDQQCMFWQIFTSLLQIETNDVSNHLASDDKRNDDLCEIISSHVIAHAILSDHSFDSNSVIENLQFQHNSKRKFFILLCRFLSMPLVMPTLFPDVLDLEQWYIHEYRSRSAVFYISVVNNEMKTEDVTFELMNSWNVY